MLKIILITFTLTLTTITNSKMLCSQCIYRYIFNYSDRNIDIFLAKNNHKFPIGINLSKNSGFLYDSRGRDVNLCIKITERESKVTNYFYIKPNIKNLDLNEYYLIYDNGNLVASVSNIIDSNGIIMGIDINSSKVECKDI